MAAPDRSLPSPVARLTNIVLGVVVAVLGVLLVLKPFGSLAVLVLLVGLGLLVTGIDELLSARRVTDSRGRAPAVVAGLAWIVAGLLAWLLPGLAIAGLAIVVGAAMIAGGALRLVGALRGTADDRLAAALLGVGSVALGLVAFGWPDVTIVIVALAFGARLFLFGLARTWSGLRNDRLSAAAPSDRLQPSRLRRWSRTIGAALGAVVALALVGLSTYLHGSAPAPDKLYDAPATIPSQAGTLIRSEPFARGIPPSARAWRILYSTTADAGTPAVASGFVAVPQRAAGPLPVISWTHGTTGVARGCAPTLQAQPFDSGQAILEAALAQGWAVVATDYIGLGTAGEHEYVVGRPAGRAALDAVRAAHQLADVELADESIVWGHSQGGQSALWAGLLAPDYATDVQPIGVAAISPASNLPALAANLPDLGAFGDLFGSFVITGYDAAYGDVRFDDYVAPLARVIVREMASRCLSQPDTLVTILSGMATGSVWGTDPSTGPLATRMAENVPAGGFAMPVLLAQGAADPLITPASQSHYVQARCAEGSRFDYRLYADKDHLSVLEAGAPLVDELVAWTADRFAGRPAASTCN